MHPSGRSDSGRKASEGGSTVRYVVILLLLAVLAGAGVIAGLFYFDITMAQTRDAVIIMYGVLGGLFFFFGIIVLLVLLFALQAASGAASDVFGESVRPVVNDTREMVGDAREMVRTARTSVEFVADSAVSPVIRVVAVARGVRRGLESMAGFGRRQG